MSEVYRSGCLVSMAVNSISDLLAEPGRAPSYTERDYTPEDYEKVKEYWEDYPVIYDENLPSRWRAPEGTAEVDGVYVNNCPFRKMRGSIKSMQSRDMAGGTNGSGDFGTNNMGTIGQFNYPLAILLRVLARMIIAADGKDYFVLPFRIKESRSIPTRGGGYGWHGKFTVQHFLIGLIETDYYLARTTEKAIVTRLRPANAIQYVFKGCGANRYGYFPRDVLGETIEDICDWHAAYYNGAIYGFKREDAKDVFYAATQMEAQSPERRKAEPVEYIGAGLVTGRRRKIDGW